jgi:hypothetical protein
MDLAHDLLSFLGEAVDLLCGFLGFQFAHSVSLDVIY